MDASRAWRRLLAAGLLTPLSALAAPPSTTAPEAHAFGRAVADDTLASLRGGEAQVTVAVDAQGTVQGNTASQVLAGDNRIDGGAFANAAGLTTVIQNSGSNVLIQHGTAVNVHFHGGP